jgi:hypothetical protein
LQPSDICEVLSHKFLKWIVGRAGVQCDLVPRRIERSNPLRIPSGILVSCFDFLAATCTSRRIGPDLKLFPVTFTPRRRWYFGFEVLFSSAWFANILFCLGYIIV